MELEVLPGVADGLAGGVGERGWGGELGGVLVEAGDGGEGLVEVGLLVSGLGLGLGGGGLRAEPGFEGGYLGEGDGTSLGGGLGIDGELEEVGEDDVFDGELGLACGAGLAGGLPGGLEDGGEDFGEIGLLGVVGVVLDEAGGAGWLKEEGCGEVRGGFNGAERVKGEAGVSGEGLTGGGEAGGTRGELGEEAVGQGKSLRREGLEDGGEGLALLVRWDGAGDEGGVSTDGVAVVEAADELGGGFGLIAMKEIEGDEGVFELGHWLAGLDSCLTEAGESGLADGEDAGELGDGVGAVVPEVSVRMGGAEGAGVFVGDVAEAGGLVLAKEGVEGFGFIDAGSELGVSEADSGFVPIADADGVGVVEGGLAGGVKSDEGVGVVHDGGALAEGGGGEVVLEAEGVADLVGGELAGAGEDHVAHGGGNGSTVEVGREEGFGDEVVLTGAEAAEGDLAFDDFASAWVGDGFTVAPAAGGAMDPLDHVVADVHGVCALREDFDAEGVFESGGLKGGGPPAGSFDEGGADGLWGAAIDVVDDGLDGLGDGGGGVALLEAMADEEALIQRVAEGLGVVAELVGVEAGAGVEAAGLVAGAGEFDEGGVFAEGDGVGVGGDLGDEFSVGGPVGDESE